MQDTLASLEKLSSGTSELLEVARGNLAIPDITEKVAKRGLVELCTAILEKICSELPKEDALSMLLEQIVNTSGLEGKPLANLLTERLSSLDERDDDVAAADISQILANIDGNESGIMMRMSAAEENKEDSEEKRASVRTRFGWA